MDAATTSAETRERALRLQRQGKGAAALKLFAEAAQAGDAEAQFQLGSCCWRVGGAADAAAFHWWRKAAASNHVGAVWHLGRMLSSGQYVSEDWEQAYTYCKTAAREGITDAAYRVATCLRDGLGVRRNYSKALALFRHLAEAGHARAMRDLSVLFLHGRVGLVQDMQLSHTWLLRAANAGSRRAQYEIALYFQSGLGCESADLMLASHYFEMAADRGHRRAREELAQMTRSIGATYGPLDEAIVKGADAKNVPSRMLQCTNCERNRLRSEFDKSGRERLQPLCRECQLGTGARAGAVAPVVAAVPVVGVADKSAADAESEAAPLKRCSICGERRTQDEYSRNQWKKATEPKCLECSNGKPDEPAAEVSEPAVKPAAAPSPAAAVPAKTVSAPAKAVPAPAAAVPAKTVSAPAKTVAAPAKSGPAPAESAAEAEKGAAAKPTRVTGGKAPAKSLGSRHPHKSVERATAPVAEPAAVVEPPANTPASAAAVAALISANSTLVTVVGGVSGVGTAAVAPAAAETQDGEVRLSAFLTRLGLLEAYWQKMRDYGIDTYNDLVMMVDKDFEDVGVKPLHRRRILDVMAADAAADSAVAAPTASGGVELRVDPIAPLGTGSSSHVLYGVHSVYGRVAVKVIPLEHHLVTDAEVEAARRVTLHTHVVALLDVHKSTTLIYLSLEHCVMDLSKLFAPPGQLSAEQRAVQELCAYKVRLVRELCAGVEHVWQCIGSLRRDLKPSSVLLSAQGTVKIANIGISRALEATTGRASAAAGWRAPELCGPNAARGKPSVSTDRFSLGLLSYYVMSGGLHPFGDDAATREKNIVAAKWVNPHLAVPLQQHFVESCLNPNLSHVLPQALPLFMSQAQRLAYLLRAKQLREQELRNMASVGWEEDGTVAELVKALTAKEGAHMAKNTAYRQLVIVDHLAKNHEGESAQLRASLSLQRPVANTDAMLFVDLKWPTLLPAVFTAFGPLTETTAARK